ncbi:SusD/RagB family nutrient-binding outer membrane lipoprotein [Chitinophagaceae bacterium LB-8]|uniref:SusD/RagB family nutrient-binding outer membrane lipoprotein n=1 Tax=Paraflavisolibacter caeni TaxID=2982496 RepID=A0A9X2XSR8_9BACT|nr:SusD/RagB family nutrient-binding outer membrane lipoprotein [Paraflavisolibacter caeni]MCU7547576.1 SusD/RagB family nutrient-binding outer membrane lipoprotein [Paraflavisolibacter caeni]
MNIKTLTLGVMVAVGINTLSSCTKGFEEMNKPYNKPTSASIGDLFNYNISTCQNSYQEQATYHSFIYEITQQATQYASSGYRMENASNEMWDSYYKMLVNSRQIDTLIAASPDKAKMTNILAMNKVIRAFRTIKMTENFGSIPYFNAGRGQYGTGNYKPAYDKQDVIYKSCINDLKWAVNNFSTSADQISLGSSETLLKNNIAQWTKLANSLRLRAAVTMYDKDNAFASAQITDALNKPLLVDGEDIGLWPSKTPGLVFEMHAWSFSANQYIRLGTTMWNQMSNNNNDDGSGIFDPRCKVFFEGNNASKWVAYPQNPTTSTPSEGGGPYDQGRFTNWANKGTGCIYSPFNFYHEDKVYMPELWITAAQVHFYRAEIYNRGLGVTKNSATAKNEYEAGVKASCNFWIQQAMNCGIWTVNKPAALPTATEFATLLANPKVAYSLTDEAAALKSIYTQLWIDGLRQPNDIWTLFRRTGGNLPKDLNNNAYWQNNYGIYHRYTYPTSEQDYNFENWKAEIGASDSYGTKIWLEK